MRTFKRCLSAFVAMAIIFTMFMTLGFSEDGEGYSPETGENDVAATYTETDEENSPESDTATPGNTEGTDIATPGNTEGTDGEPEAGVGVPPDENAATYDNSISGSLWLDMFEDINNGTYSGDGIRQPSEEPLAGYDVSLYKADNLSVALLTVKTKSQGEYIFTGLEPGGYAVGISSGILEEVEYLLPLMGVSGDNRFNAPDETTDYKTAFSDTVNVAADTHADGINASMRTPPGIQMMDVGALTVTRDRDGSVLYQGIKWSEAITAINGDIDGVSYTITVNTDTNIDSDLTINTGKYVTIKSDGKTNFKIFYPITTGYRHFVTNGSLTLENITLDGSSNNRGGVQVNKDGTLTMKNGTVIEKCASSQGAAVSVRYGTLTMYDATIQNCTSPNGYGGGVNVDSTGSLIMNKGATIQNCSAKVGGGGGGVYFSGTLMTMYDGAKILDCKADSGYGGGVYFSSGTFNMYGGEIKENTAAAINSGQGSGGGVGMYSSSAKFNMFGGEISGNKASVSPGQHAYGGGVYAATGTFNMSGGKISGNIASKSTTTATASGFGGGVYFWSPGTFTMSGGEISGNKTGNNNGQGGGVLAGGTFIMNGGEISGNTATVGNGGGVYLAAGGKFTVTDSSSSKIINNSAPLGNGGGIYTADATYGNLNLSDETYFDENTAKEAYAYSGEALDNIKAAHTSIGGSDPLNNYDINCLPGKMLPTGRPTIKIGGDGTMKIGQGLTAGVDTLNPSTGLTYQYQWKADGQSISGATDTTYTVQKSDAGKAITVTVTVTGSDTYSGSATSKETGVVLYNINLALSPSGKIGADNAYFGSHGTITAYASRGTEIEIKYILDSSNIVNKVVFGKASIPDGTTLGTEGSVKYTVSDSDAWNGEINITVSFIHQNIISSEDVSVTPPVNGKPPQSSVVMQAPYYAGAGTVTWNPGDATFGGGTSYTATITLTTIDGVSFSPGFAPTVNGSPATSVTVLSGGKTAVFTYKFPRTLTKTVSGISIKTQPQRVYTSGDKLNLSGLEVTVTYENNTTEDIPFASLTGASYSIDGETVISGQTFLTYVTHNGKKVKISYGGEPAETNALTVYTLPTIKTSVSDITSESATISYVVFNSGNYTTKTIQRLDDSGWVDVLSDVSPSSSCTETGLISNKFYQYRVRVFNNDTKMLYESPISFKTLADNPNGANVSGTVNGDSGQTVTVTIERGNTVIASTKATDNTNNTYSYNFKNIPHGIYNLVSNNGEYKVTRAVAVSGEEVHGPELYMTRYKKQSVVQIVGGGTPDAAVDGLPELFRSTFYTSNGEALVANGGEVEFKLAVEEMKADDIPSDAAMIKSLAWDKEIGLYLDLSLIKSRYDTNGKLLDRIYLTDIGTNFIDIYFELPDDLKGKGNLTVYRVNDGRAEALTSSSGSNREYAKTSGDYVKLHVCKFSTYAIAYKTNTIRSSGNSRSSGGGGSGGGSGGGGGSGSAVTDVGTYWIEVPEAKTMAKDALGKQLDYVRSSRDTITGIRKNSLLVLAESGLRYRHDTVSNDSVQVRVHIDDPSKAEKDILVSGYVKSESVDNVKAKFEKKFQNKLAVISLDQEGGFGTKAQIVAKVNLSGMNTKSLYFYSYDKNTNKFARIETEYKIDGNGYLHFATMLGGNIIVSEGPFAKHGAEQSLGASETMSPQDLHNPNTGGYDSPSETWIAGNLSPLTDGNGNINNSGNSPVDMRITGNVLPLTIENYNPGNSGGQEIMLSASISQNEFRTIKRGGYVNIKMIVISVVLLFAGILVGVDIPRLWKLRNIMADGNQASDRINSIDR